MKIAIVIERLEQWRGGAETSTLELAGLLAQRGHDVHLVSTSGGVVPGLTLHTVKTLTPLKSMRLSSFLRAVTRFIGSHSFDIVHAIAPLAAANVYQPRGGSVAETLDRNIALREGEWSRLFKRLALKLSLKQHTLLRHEREICRPGGPMIACVSGYVAEQFARHYGLTSDRLEVVFNGVNPPRISTESADQARAELRQAHGAGPLDTVLLTVAQNFRLKGVARLIDAVALLKARGHHRVQAWVVGGDNSKPFMLRARSLGVTCRIVFVGQSSQVAEYMTAADALIHPTYYDPCSRVVLEAMMLGLPAVTTRFNGAAEKIQHGINGFVVDSPDAVQSLAASMEQLLDASVRRKIAEAARATARNLTMARHVDGLITLYERILSRHAGAQV